MELYLHIPFCVRKCNYCDFVSFPGREAAWDAYRKALCRDICLGGEHFHEQVDTIFIGGGTPSLMPDGFYRALFSVLREQFVLADDCEITIECNPGTVTADKLLEYREVGINRISMGVQSANDQELQMLGRIHTWEEVAATRKLIADAGYDNLNLDIMMALPKQTEESYYKTLEQVIALKPAHISAYSLIVEPETVCGRWYEEHPEWFPEEELQCTLYRETVRRLAEAGYEQYEISNFAKPGMRCRHNMGYWSGETYLGLGPAAASFDGKKRWKNADDLEAYLKACTITEEEVLGEEDLLEEYVMLGLRTTDGITSEQILKRTDEKRALRMLQKMDRFVSEGLLQKKEERYFCTVSGFLVNNHIIATICS